MTNLHIVLENLTNGYNITFISILSTLALFFGISVIVSKNPIVSVLFLISLFCIIASYLITLGMSFIGLSYLLVYVGAISILFLFILMLINIRISELVTDNRNGIPLAILAGLAFSIPVHSILPFDIYMFDVFNVSTLYYTDNTTNNTLLTLYDAQILSQNISNNPGFVTSKLWDGNIADISDISSIGNVMYSNVFIWLIVTSLILLLAMVGAILITIKTTNKSSN